MRCRATLVVCQAWLAVGCSVAHAAGPEAFDLTPSEGSDEVQGSGGLRFETTLARARSGDARAQSRLALMYLDGRDVEQNDASAFSWFRRAAEAGEPSAAHYVGLLYLSGKGTDVDLAAATKWLRRCAEAHEPDRLLSLAWLSIDNGLPRGAVQTAGLFRMAAENGYALAQHALGRVARHRDGEDARAEAVEWLTRSAEQGEIEAQFDLGSLYLEGWSAQRQPELAMVWFRRAAGGGHARAMRNLGVSHYTGVGSPTDRVAAYGWFLLASRNGNAPAQHDVGLLEQLLSEEQVALARDWADRWQPD